MAITENETVATEPGWWESGLRSPREILAPLQRGGDDGLAEDFDRMNRIDRIKSPLQWGRDDGLAEDFILSIL